MRYCRGNLTDLAGNSTGKTDKVLPADMERRQVQIASTIKSLEYCQKITPDEKRQSKLKRLQIELECKPKEWIFIPCRG